jgi:ferredoxin, 2Fe-2S
MSSELRNGVIRFGKPDLKSSRGDVEVANGTLLMDALLKIGLPVASSCRGDGVCTKCRLHVRELEPGAASPISDFEQGLLDRIQAENDERISCQTEVLGLIEVDADYW